LNFVLNASWSLYQSNTYTSLSADSQMPLTVEGIPYNFCKTTSFK
jgi:hypothetical protein